jgi:hypothetical protein
MVGRITVFLRENAIQDEVDGKMLRISRLAKKMQDKARAQAKKFDNFNAAVETPLANTRSALDAEVAAYGKSKGALRTYLQEQFKSRKSNNLKVASFYILFGIYRSIPLQSEYRSRAKPYPLRMNPEPAAG